VRRRQRAGNASSIASRACCKRMGRRTSTPKPCGACDGEAVPEFLDQVCRNIDWSEFTVVGFTSRFQQNTASLALARRLKERFPGVLILFGGANLDSEMGPELVRAFPWVDFGISGEADLAFPAFLSALQEGQDLTPIRGLLSEERPDVPPAEATADLESLPLPRYTSNAQSALAC
jgi:hypothetical protein